MKAYVLKSILFDGFKVLSASSLLVNAEKYALEKHNKILVEDVNNRLWIYELIHLFLG